MERGCGLAGAAAASASAAFIPPIVLDLGWPQESVGLLLLIQGVSAVVAAHRNGWLVARWGEAGPALAGLGMVAIASVLLYAVGGVVALPIVLALTGAAYGFLQSLAMGLAARSLSSRSQGISVHETYLSLGLGAGPFLGGLTTTWLGTPQAGMLSCAVFAALGLLAVSRGRGLLEPARLGTLRP